LEVNKTLLIGAFIAILASSIWVAKNAISDYGDGRYQAGEIDTKQVSYKEGYREGYEYGHDNGWKAGYLHAAGKKMDSCQVEHANNGAHLISCPDLLPGEEDNVPPADIPEYAKE